MSYFLSIVAAIVVLGVLIIVHEAGHYLAGRLLKLPVVEFAIGMGPKLLGFTRKGISYSIRALPLGGFCAFNGEDDPEAEADERLLDPSRADVPSEWRNLNNCPPWRRLVMQFAGSAMNLFTAYLCAVVLLCAIGMPVSLSRISALDPQGPAAAAGVLEGDYIVSVNGVEGASIAAEVAKTSDGIDVVLERGEETVTVRVAPQYYEDTQSKRIGVSLGLRYEQMPLGDSIATGASFCVELGKEMISFLRNLLFRGEGASDVMGIVGTVDYMAGQTSDYFSDGTRSGFYMVFQFAILLALNLGIINLLPIPALDGGRIVFTLIELIFRRPVPRRAEAWIHTAGFVVLMGLMVVLFFKDIATILGFGGAA